MAGRIKFKLKSNNNVEYCGKFPENNNYHIMYLNEKNEVAFTTIEDCEIIN